MLENKDNKFLKIKKVVDERGFSIFFKDFPLKKFHIVSLNPSAIRGDHIHNYCEIICVLGGNKAAEITLYFPEGQKKILVNEDFQIIEIPSMVRHIVKNIGDKVFYLVCFCLGCDNKVI